MWCAKFIKQNSNNKLYINLSRYIEYYITKLSYIKTRCDTYNCITILLL